MGEDAIVVRILASIGGLTTGLNEATAAVEESTAVMSGAFTAVGTAIETMMGPFVAILAVMKGGELFGEAISDTVEMAEHLEVLSQKTGIAVEQLSALAFAAKMVNVDAGALDTGFKKLATSMQDALVSPSGKAGKAFQAMGLDVKDFHGDLNEALLQIADKMATYADGANKSALMTDLFGRSGTDLIPIMNLGASGIKGMTDEAAKLGVVMDDQQARTAKEYADRMKIVHAEMAATGRSIATELMPFLGTLADLFLKLIDFGVKLIEKVFAPMKWAIDQISEGLALMWTAYADGIDVAEQVGAALKTLDNQIDVGGTITVDRQTKQAPSIAGVKTPEQIKKEEIEAARVAAAAAADEEKIEDDAEKARKKALSESEKLRLKTEEELKKKAAADEKERNKELVDEQERESKYRMKLIEDYQHKWEAAFSVISSTIAASFDGVIRGTQTVNQAFDNLARNILLTMVRNIEKAFEIWLATEITKRAVGAASAKRSILNDAYEGAAKAWKATAGIPYVGPFLAPAAAAAAFAAVAAFGSGISAAGGFDIPAGLNPMTQLHAREMVLPAAIADGLRGLIAGGGGGGGVTVYAMDAQSFQSFLHTNRDSMVPALQALARNGALGGGRVG